MRALGDKDECIIIYPSEQVHGLFRPILFAMHFQPSLTGSAAKFPFLCSGLLSNVATECLCASCGLEGMHFPEMIEPDM